MPVITIRGQYGSEAGEIGELIAHKLGIDYVDRNIIATVAERLRRPSYTIEKKEMPPSTLLGRIAEAMSNPYIVDSDYMGLSLPTWEMPLDDADYLSGLRHVIEELARSRSIVIRGRGSQFILKDLPGAFHLLVVTPLERRVKRVMEEQDLSEGEAGREIMRFDRGQRKFIQRYFDAAIDDPVNYDLVINTAHFSIENAAATVISVLPLKRASA
jgi:hypothetical protein